MSNSSYGLKAVEFLLNVLTIPLNQLNDVEKLVILFNYTLKDFVFEQGDYNVFHLNVQSRVNKIDKTNRVILPTNTSIPRTFPKNSRVGQYEDRWVFDFIGENNIDEYIIYTDEAEIASKRINENIIFLIVGALVTFIFSISASSVHSYSKK